MIDGDKLGDVCDSLHCILAAIRARVVRGDIQPDDDAEALLGHVRRALDDIESLRRRVALIRASLGDS